MQKTTVVKFDGVIVTATLQYFRDNRPGYFRGYYSEGVHLPGTNRWLHLWLPDGSSALWRCLVYSQGAVIADAYGGSAAYAVGNAERSLGVEHRTRTQELVNAFAD